MTEHDLTCRLDEIKDGIARVRITGSAGGIGLGAQVKTLVNARYDFDVAAKRVRRRRVEAERRASKARSARPSRPT